MLCLAPGGDQDPNYRGTVPSLDVRAGRRVRPWRDRGAEHARLSAQQDTRTTLDLVWPLDGAASRSALSGTEDAPRSRRVSRSRRRPYRRAGTGSALSGYATSCDRRDRSLDNRYPDVIEKLKEYRKWGVPHVWLVDPNEKRLGVYNESGLQDVTSLTLLEYNFEIPAQALFAGL